MTILWIKALHIFFMVAWMSGLFYLPRLMVYHAQTDVQAVKDQFKIMERRLWYFITPFAILTLVFGVWLISLYGKEWFVAAKWLHLKLTLVSVVYIYHFYLFKLLRTFANDQNTHSPRFFRFLNEAPVLIVLAIIVLASVKFL
ncbi:CopD family protein [uncultured Paraglaciecola sp.]|uniref:CopD family protein n=1 Tax=uncultured Paraglaciecola sp. TaxID=1765024 RepID=UPI0030D8B29F|tara:strand:+ start:166051 stop:166479 length:429 start_codon:yes stop_codon:yes gene_type:complete